MEQDVIGDGMWNVLRHIPTLCDWAVQNIERGERWFPAQLWNEKINIFTLFFFMGRGGFRHSSDPSYRKTTSKMTALWLGPTHYWSKTAGWLPILWWNISVSSVDNILRHGRTPSLGKHSETIRIIFRILNTEWSGTSDHGSVSFDKVSRSTQFVG